MQTGPCGVLVDDDPDGLTLTRVFLLRVWPDLEVVTFSNGLEALAYLVSAPASLVLTDFRMPGMDGLQLTGHLRSMGNQVPIIVMSGNPVEPQALAAGADAFLRKSDIPAKLGGVLHSLGLVLSASRDESWQIPEFHPEPLNGYDSRG